MKSRYSLAGKLGAIESAKTASLRKQQRTQAYDLEPKLCKCCKLPIAYEQRRNDFCGHSCAASVTNKGVKRSKLKPPPCRLCCATLKRNASKFCSHNHRPENLRLLCPNCHSLTATYGGLNRGRGRKERYLSDSG